MPGKRGVVHVWFNLVEEALYDSVSMRRFAGIDLGEMPVPDESTVLRFCHLLEAHGLGKKLFQQVHAYLERQGIKVGCSATIKTFG
jgi:transposase, IS5 family